MQMARILLRVSTYGITRCSGSHNCFSAKCNTVVPVAKLVLPVTYSHYRQLPLSQQQVRTVTTTVGKPSFDLIHKPSLWARVKDKLSWRNIKERQDTRCACALLYLDAMDQINHVDFFQILKLPDTLFSWFTVTELHVWMLMTRAMQNTGLAGRTARDEFVMRFWCDSTERLKAIEEIPASQRRTELNLLNDQFNAALLGYDEGLQRSDSVLAGAMWRRVFMKTDEPDIHAVETLLRYTHCQLKLLDDLSWEEFLAEGSVKWKPLRTFVGEESGGGRSRRARVRY